MKTHLIAGLTCLTLHVMGQEPIYEDHFYNVHLAKKSTYWGIASVPTTRPDRYQDQYCERIEDYDFTNMPPGNTYLWNYDYILEAYVNAIKSETSIARKKEYTDMAIDLAAFMLDHRDDNDVSRPVGIRRYDEHPTETTPRALWIMKDYYNNYRFESNPGITGRITYPMAELANVILGNQSFYQTKIYQPVVATTPYLSSRYANVTYQTLGSGWNTNGYRLIAGDLIAKVNQSVQLHCNTSGPRAQWRDIGADQGAFYHEYWVCDATVDARFKGISNVVNFGTYYPYYLEYNYMAAIGNALIATYNGYKKLHALTGTYATEVAFYKEKVRRLGNYMRAARYYRTSDSDWYWYYANTAFVTQYNAYRIFNGLCSFGQYTNYPEDVEHAFLMASFMHNMAFQCSDVYYTGGTTVPVFNQTTDMQELTDMVNNTYYGSGNPGRPWWFYTNINGDEMTSPTIKDSIPEMGAFIRFSEWDPDLYYMLSDYNLTDVLAENQGSFPFFLLSEAMLYSKKSDNTPVKARIRPLNISYGFGSSSQWIAVEGGDLNGDDLQKEYVCVRQFDEKFFLCRANSNGTITAVTDLAATGTWVDLAVGNFCSGFPGDEFVAVKNYNGTTHFYLYRYNGTSIVQVATYTGYGNGSVWKGICAADLDNDGVDEIAAIRNNEGFLVTFKYNGTSTLAGGTWSLNTGTTNWKSLEAGDINYSGADEIVGVTYDGKIKIFTPSGSTFTATPFLLTSLPYTIRGASLGDFNRNHKHDDLILSDVNGFFYRYIINTSPSYSISYINEDVLENTWFSNYDPAIGNISLSKKDCDEDKLILLRNSTQDGAMFIFDAAFVKDNGWECSGGGGDSKMSKEDPGKGTEIIFDQHSALHISPNPVSNLLSFAIKGNTNPVNYTVEVYNQLGKKILAGQNEPGQLNVESLETGMYILLVRQGEKTWTGKFIKSE